LLVKHGPSTAASERLGLVEEISAGGTGPPPALIFAVNMVVHSEDGDTFSQGEIGEWLHDAGYRSSAGPFPRQLLATRLLQRDQIVLGELPLTGAEIPS
jgi:hypothetical protein